MHYAYWDSTYPGAAAATESCTRLQADEAYVGRLFQSAAAALPDMKEDSMAVGSMPTMKTRAAPCAKVIASLFRTILVPARARWSAASDTRVEECDDGRLEWRTF